MNFGDKQSQEDIISNLLIVKDDPQHKITAFQIIKFFKLKNFAKQKYNDIFKFIENDFEKSKDQYISNSPLKKNNKQIKNIKSSFSSTIKSKLFNIRKGSSKNNDVFTLNYENVIIYLQKMETKNIIIEKEKNVNRSKSLIAPSLIKNDKIKENEEKKEKKEKNFLQNKRNRSEKIKDEEDKKEIKKEDEKEELKIGIKKEKMEDLDPKMKKEFEKIENGELFSLDEELETTNDFLKNFGQNIDNTFISDIGLKDEVGINEILKNLSADEIKKEIEYQNQVYEADYNWIKLNEKTKKLHAFSLKIKEDNSKQINLVKDLFSEMNEIKSESEVYAKQLHEKVKCLMTKIEKGEKLLNKNEICEKINAYKLQEEQYSKILKQLNDDITEGKQLLEKKMDCYQIKGNEKINGKNREDVKAQNSNISNKKSNNLKNNNNKKYPSSPKK